MFTRPRYQVSVYRTIVPLVNAYLESKNRSYDINNSVNRPMLSRESARYFI